MWILLKALAGLSAGAVVNACAQAGIDPKRRPETLSALEFLALARSVRQTLSGNWL